MTRDQLILEWANKFRPNFDPPDLIDWLEDAPDGALIRDCHGDVYILALGQWCLMASDPDFLSGEDPCRSEDLEKPVPLRW